MSPIEALKKILELLQIEKDEDHKQYLEQFERAGITQRRLNGVTWYPLRIVSEEVGAGDYIMLEVERTQGQDELHQFGNGKVVELFSNADERDKENKLSGTIKNVWGNCMRIALNTDDLPDWIDRGKLGINLLFDENSYREMFFGIKRVMEAEKNRLAHLRDVIYGLKPAAFNVPEQLASAGGLNASQLAAVQLIASAEDVALVHGPPGTGKTTTLIQAIRHTLLHEKQVLVCSPSNVAVDLLTEKLVQQGISVLRLGNPARVSEEVMNNTLDMRMMQHASYKDLKAYRKRAEEFFAMARKYKRSFGPAEREQRNLLFTEAKQLLKEATALEDYIQWEQFDTVQVIACTPVVAASKAMRDKKFRTVFIDEAAQALEPMSWIPIARAERVVLAGDHCQLPPTVKSRKAEEGGLKYTLFERVVENQKQATALLKTQYRMNDDIMQFSNRSFYDGALESDLTVKDTLLSHDPSEDLLCRPFDFFDTAGCGYNEQFNPETLSVSNPEEADLLLRYLGSVLAQYDALSHEASAPLRIGIIAPYRQQTEYLTQQLATQDYFTAGKHHFSVRTVDGFQGQERDIICISMVRSNDQGDIGFLADTRRMNVALTRAKRKLIVFGDSATLANHSFYKKFLDYVDEKGAYHTAWEIMEV
jgi:superfamily I DNA and/or RNA helicase